MQKCRRLYESGVATKNIYNIYIHVIYTRRRQKARGGKKPHIRATYIE